jgi:succinyl-CoA synthetase beta subunit
MKLHEYQAKELLRASGIPVPEGRMIRSPHEASEAALELGGGRLVVKAQIHAGGRGKGGGVRVVEGPDQAREAAADILSRPLITPQTGPEGQSVNQILVERAAEIEMELYLGMVIDRRHARPVMIFSQEGGMEIEEVAALHPERVLRQAAPPEAGWMPFCGRSLAYRLDPLPPAGTIKALMGVMAGVYNAFVRRDCSLLEINPLVVTGCGDVLAVDAKMNIDDSALFRQKDLAEMDDPGEKDPLERKAAEYNLNYIRLDGNIGAMVNGAGLAMATMDVIKAAGAEPANFLDVGGGASEEMITKGFEIILEDRKVKAILINIFGGILRCDVLARGVLAAAKKTAINVPLIVRLEGTNVDEGRRILEESDLEFLVARDMAEAAELVTRQVSGK